MMFRKYFYIFTICCIFIPAIPVWAQEPDARQILEDVQKKFLLVKEYEANVKIKVDVDFVKIPEKSGTIWFMQPDKVKVKTPGFSLLPKRGMNFSPNQLFEGGYTAIYAREELVENFKTHVVKVIPQNEQDDIILSTLWIDIERNVIRKLETTTKNEGTFSMIFRFPESVQQYDLPGQIIFNFDIRKNELPMGLTGDFDNAASKGKSSKSSRGVVTISYLKYIVNEGKAIPLFNKKASK